MGKILFYLLWPLVWFYAPLRVRVRVTIVHKDEVLVVKNWFGSRHWQLPGGGVKIGESIQNAAAREVHEELGIELQPEKLTLLNNESVLVRHSGLLLRYYYAYIVLDKKPTDIVKSKELTDYSWKMFENVKTPEVITARKLVSK